MFDGVYVGRVEVAWERAVSSSFIQKVGFARVRTDDGDLRRFVLVRIEGKLYPYEAPPWVLGLMIKAHLEGRSVGKIFSRHLRHRFPRAA